MPKYRISRHFFFQLLAFESCCKIKVYFPGWTNSRLDSSKIYNMFCLSVLEVFLVVYDGNRGNTCWFHLAIEPKVPFQTNRRFDVPVQDNSQKKTRGSIRSRKSQGNSIVEISKQQGESGKRSDFHLSIDSERSHSEPKRRLSSSLRQQGASKCESWIECLLTN